MIIHWRSSFAKSGHDWSQSWNVWSVGTTRPANTSLAPGDQRVDFWTRSSHSEPAWIGWPSCRQRYRRWGDLCPDWRHQKLWRSSLVSRGSWGWGPRDFREGDSGHTRKSKERPSLWTTSHRETRQMSYISSQPNIWSHQLVPRIVPHHSLPHSQFSTWHQPRLPSSLRVHVRPVKFSQ